jgi:hypothetical protein
MCAVASALGGPASENGRLRHGDEAHGPGGRCRRALMLAMLAISPTRSPYRPFRNSSMAALTSLGRSCCVQCPQPGSITVFRKFGTNIFRLGIS